MFGYSLRRNDLDFDQTIGPVVVDRNKLTVMDRLGSHVTGVPSKSDATPGFLGRSEERQKKVVLLETASLLFILLAIALLFECTQVKMSKIMQQIYKVRLGGNYPA